MGARPRLRAFAHQTLAHRRAVSHRRLGAQPPQHVLVLRDAALRRVDRLVDLGAPGRSHAQPPLRGALLGELRARRRCERRLLEERLLKDVEPASLGTSECLKPVKLGAHHVRAVLLRVRALELPPCLAGGDGRPLVLPGELLEQLGLLLAQRVDVAVVELNLLLLVGVHRRALRLVQHVGRLLTQVVSKARRPLDGATPASAAVDEDGRVRRRGSGRCLRRWLGRRGRSLHLLAGPGESSKPNQNRMLAQPLKRMLPHVHAHNAEIRAVT